MATHRPDGQLCACRWAAFRVAMGPPLRQSDSSIWLICTYIYQYAYIYTWICTPDKTVVFLVR